MPCGMAERKHSFHISMSVDVTIDMQIERKMEIWRKREIIGTEREKGDRERERQR